MDSVPASPDASYRTIFDASVNAILILDWDTGAIIDVNRQACESTGYTLEEMKRLKADDLSDGRAPYTWATALAYMEQARGGRAAAFEWRRRNKNGSVTWDEVVMKPATLGGERVLIAFARDITAHKKALEELRRSEARLRATVDAALDCIVAMDQEGRVLEFNGAAERVFGWTREEAVGRKLSDLLLPQRFRAAHEQGLERFRQTAAGPMIGRLVETTALRRDGTELPVELAISVADAPEGSIFVGHIRDISARRAAETERSALEAQLRQAQKMEAIGQLTGGIAHDFNNILTSVIGYVVLGQERAEMLGDAALVRQLGQAQLAAQRAKDLIAQMLAFARRQKGDPRPVAVTPLVRQTLRLLRSTLPSSIVLDAQWMDADGSGEETWVLADPVQLEQIVFNLCINARDAMDGNGRITVRLGRTAPSRLTCASCRGIVEGSWVELQVRDTGHGIEPHLLDRIFDPFFSTKPPGQGSGMGLAMVHGIVHDHGGHVLVDSSPKRGAMFTVLLPPTLPAHLPEERARNPARVTAGLAPGEVLLVEDDPFVGNYLEEQLSRWGLAVKLCRSPADALRLLQSHGADPQLLLTDLTMPGMTGLQLAREARKLRPNLSVLIVTGNADEIDDAVLREHGVAQVLRKPLDAQELGAVLSRLFEAA